MLKDFTSKTTVFLCNLLGATDNLKSMSEITTSDVLTEGLSCLITVIKLFICALVYPNKLKNTVLQD